MMLRMSIVAHIVVFAVSAAAQAADPGPCFFCPRGNITTPQKPINIPGFEFLTDCVSVDALVPFAFTNDAPECDLMQKLSTYCGCPPPEDSCSLCPDGEPVPNSDLEVPWLKQIIGFAPTCDMVDAITASFSSKGDSCRDLQYSASSYCGCPAIENHCVFCDGEPVDEAYRQSLLSPVLTNPYLEEDGLLVTCEMAYFAQYQLPNDVYTCSFFNDFLAFHCGCNNGEFLYMGASNEKEKKTLVWVPRAVGMVSLAASLFVLWDISSSKKKRRSLYHQLICLIVIFDMVTSLVWIVGPAALPSVSAQTGMDNGIYGTGGSEATCTAQGFFFQLGATSVYLNVSLTVYYLLVIASNRRESFLKKMRMWLFGLPLVFGFGLAFAVIPFVKTGYIWCQFNAFSMWQVLLFGVVPVITATVAILVMLVVLYWKVRKMRRNNDRRWAFGARRRDDSSMVASVNTQRSAQPDSSVGSSRHNSSLRSVFSANTTHIIKDRLEREVFFQCIRYALSFSFTWPLLALAQFRVHEEEGLPYWVWLLVVFAAPLQGFNNALCYLRPFKSPRWEAIRSFQFCVAVKDTKMLSCCFSRQSDQTNNNNNEELIDGDAAVEQDPTFQLANLNDDAAQVVQTNSNAIVDNVDSENDELSLKSCSDAMSHADESVDATVGVLLDSSREPCCSSSS